VAEPDIDVSVVVAVRNGAATLEPCIDSVLTQTGCHVELIIVDALSDDGTREIVASYGDAIATYIREADTGIYDAWNKALAVARGKWCIFLGADDYFTRSDSLRLLIDVSASNDAEPAFVYGGVVRVAPTGNYEVHVHESDISNRLRRAKMLPHNAILHSTELLNEIGHFDTSFDILGDLDALLKMTEKGVAARCAEIVTAVRVGGISNASESRKRVRQERRRIIKGQHANRYAANFFYLVARGEELAGAGMRSALYRLLDQEEAARVMARLLDLIHRPGRGVNGKIK